MSGRNALIDEMARIGESPIFQEEHDVKAAEVASAICDLIGEILLRDDDESRALDKWEEAVRDAWAEQFGGGE